MEQKELIQVRKEIELYTKENLVEMYIDKYKEAEGLKEKLITLNKITDTENWFDMSQVAKLLHTRDNKYKIYGRNIIYAILRDAGILNSNNEPKQKHCDNGCFKLIVKDLYEKTGFHKLQSVPLISLKGIDLTRSILDDIIEKK